MRRTVWRRLDTVARQTVPCTLTFLLLLAGAVPLHAQTLQAVAPSLPLIAVFYWTLYRPDLMPAVCVFFIGLLQDVLCGLPLGVGAGVLVCVHAAVDTQRAFFIGKSFGVVWLGFAVVAGIALMLQWLIVCAWYGTLVTPDRSFFQALTTIGTFPLVSWVLLRCQLSLLEPA